MAEEKSALVFDHNRYYVSTHRAMDNLMNGRNHEDAIVTVKTATTKAPIPLFNFSAACLEALPGVSPLAGPRWQSSRESEFLRRSFHRTRQLRYPQLPQVKLEEIYDFLVASVFATHVVGLPFWLALHSNRSSISEHCGSAFQCESLNWDDC